MFKISSSTCGLIDETTEAQKLKSLSSKENEVLENTLIRKLDYEFFRNTFGVMTFGTCKCMWTITIQIDPVTHYAKTTSKSSRHVIIGFSDAMSDAGFDLRKEIDSYGRDKVGCLLDAL